MTLLLVLFVVLSLCDSGSLNQSGSMASYSPLVRLSVVGETLPYLNAMSELSFWYSDYFNLVMLLSFAYLSVLRKNFIFTDDCLCLCQQD